MTPQSQPPACPKCGAEQFQSYMPGNPAWCCGSLVSLVDGEYCQSKQCSDAQISSITIAKDAAEGKLADAIEKLNCEKEEAVANQDFDLAKSLVSILAIIERG